MRSETKRALTPGALDALLRFLDDDPERAAAEYERIRQRLIKLFRWRGCLNFHDYADATVDRVAHLIGGGTEIRTGNPYALFYGVAINLLREHWRETERERRVFGALRHAPATAPAPDEVIEQRDADRARERRLRCLRACLERLPADSLALITRYYGEGSVLDKDQRKALARELNVSINALRVRAHRIRSDVGGCVEDCTHRAPHR